MEPKEIRTEEIQSAVDGIFEFIFLATISTQAISELQMYLEYSLKKFPLPKTEEEEKEEVEKYIEQVSPYKEEKIKELQERIESGRYDHAKYLRETGVERKIHSLIFIGLLHHQEDFLKYFGLCNLFFNKKIHNGLTFGRLLQTKEKNSINNTFNFKCELFEQDFCQSITECNSFCNVLKHNNRGTVNRVLEINKNLIYKYTHNITGLDAFEMILSARAFLRYVESFKNFWIFIYSKIDEKANYHKEKISHEEISGFEKTIKIIDHFNNIFFQAKNNLEESIKKQMPE